VFLLWSCPNFPGDGELGQGKITAEPAQEERLEISR
jgi:hypothetical protein